MVAILPYAINNKVGATTPCSKSSIQTLNTYSRLQRSQNINFGFPRLASLALGAAGRLLVTVLVPSPAESVLAQDVQARRCDGKPRKD